VDATLSQQPLFPKGVFPLSPRAIVPPSTQPGLARAKPAFRSSRERVRVITSEWYRFAEKVRLAVETSRHNDPGGGTSGLEVEFNILDGDLKPVERVGYGPEGRSFADYLHDERLPDWARDRFQLEVFHWMTELTTRPFFSPEATAAEARLLEGALLNTLAELRLSFGESFFAHHGNIAGPWKSDRTASPTAEPGRKRYLRRCVELLRPRLATAGIHTSTPTPRPCCRGIRPPAGESAASARSRVPQPGGDPRPGCCGRCARSSSRSAPAHP
jgi:hypothetical protein